MLDAAERRFWRWASRNQSCPLMPDVDGHCWIWVGARTAKKAPLFWFEGRTRSAVRWIWEREHGPVPAGKQLSPTCGQSMCVRPSHRELRRRGSHIRRKAA